MVVGELTDAASNGVTWVKDKVDQTTPEQKAEAGAFLVNEAYHHVNQYDANQYDPYNISVKDESPSVGDEYYGAYGEALSQLNEKFKNDIYQPIGMKTTGYRNEPTERFAKLSSWMRMPSLLKIEPLHLNKTISGDNRVQQMQEGLGIPQSQRFPIAGVKVNPHQISFNFFEGADGDKIGISNASEKCMVVEFDVYVTQLLYFYWNHWYDRGNEFDKGVSSWNAATNAYTSGGGSKSAYTGLRFMDEERRKLDQLMQSCTDAKTKNPLDEGYYGVNSEGILNWATSKGIEIGQDLISKYGKDYLKETLGVDLDELGAGESLNHLSDLLEWKVNDFQDTVAFQNFRNNFLVAFTGWTCKFTSQTFGSFDGVITDMQYEIEDGFSDAKWHVKVEEAITTNADTSITQESPDAAKTTSNGSTTNSG